MPTPTKLQTPNGPIDGYEMSFEVIKEPWLIIKVEDGTELKMRINVSKVFRANTHNPDGDPLYSISNKIDIRVRVTDPKLKQTNPAKPRDSPEVQ